MSTKKEQKAYKEGYHMCMEDLGNWDDVKAQWQKEERDRLIKEIDFFIAEECNQVRKDGFPTSRLTSLAMKIHGLLK